MHKRFTTLLFTFLIVGLQLFWSQALLAQQKIVVIDAGHGGKDNGCSGIHSVEKDLTLALSTQLESYLYSHYPQISVLLTRDDDRFLTLGERSEIANNQAAHLFVSIHCNHHQVKAVHGSEIFIMGVESVDNNLEVVIRENKHVDENGNTIKSESTENHILQSMFQYSFLAESAEFARLVQKRMSENTDIKQRGVKQAGFSVLRNASMPGILFETAYLSNPENETYLLSEKGQKAIVKSMAEAISEYFKESINDEQIATQYEIFLLEADTAVIKDMDEKWSLVSEIRVQERKDSFAFYTGTFSDFQSVHKKTEYLKQNGFADAMIILKSK